MDDIKEYRLFTVIADILSESNAPISYSEGFIFYKYELVNSRLNMSIGDTENIIASYYYKVLNKPVSLICTM